MKNYTQQEIKTAKRWAYSFLTYSFVESPHKQFRYDGRTRIGNLAATYVGRFKNKINRDAIKAKRKTRREAKRGAEFINIFSRPIVKDWLSNRCVAIHQDHLQDGSRNHWAKDAKDFKILEVLRKHKQFRKLAA